jgi:hypothetical protein
MGQILTIFGKYSGYVKKSMLGNPVSAIAQLTQNTIAVVSAVGSPTYMPKGVSNVFKLMAGGLEAFDDTNAYIKFGTEAITERELMTRIVMTRGSNNLNTELTGVNQLNTTKLSQMWQHDFKAGIERAKLNLRFMPVSTIVGSPGAVVDQMFKPVAFANFVSDIAGRYAIVATLNNPTLAAANNFLSRTSTPQSVEEALQYADEYLGFFDAKSELSSVASTYIRPFAAYLMNAPGQVLRHAMRHPRRFYNTMRYYHHHAISSARENNGYDLNSWQRDKMLVPVWEDKATGQKVFFDPSTMVGEFATLGLIDQTLNTLTRLTGGTTRNKIADLEARVNPAKTAGNFLGSLIEGNYFETINSAITGRNPFTGADPTAESGFKTATLFNIPMSPQIRAILLLGMPAANQLDRMLPAQISGQREIRDVTGLGVARKGVPGIFGNVPESGGYNGDFFTNVGLGSVGLRPTYADTALNVVNNASDVDRVIADGTRVQRYLIQRGRQSSNEFALVTQAIRDAQMLKLDINRYALEKNLTPPEAIKLIKSELNRPVSDALRYINKEVP